MSGVNRRKKGWRKKGWRKKGWRKKDIVKQ
jgi:hypothetical protein